MKIELDYVKVGDYYLPGLIIEPPDRSLGKYGLLRLRYLKVTYFLYCDLVYRLFFQ